MLEGPARARVVPSSFYNHVARAASLDPRLRESGRDGESPRRRDPYPSEPTVTTILGSAQLLSHTHYVVSCTPQMRQIMFVSPSTTTAPVVTV